MDEPSGVSTATVKRYFGLAGSSVSAAAPLTPTTLRFQAYRAWRRETPGTEGPRRALNFAVALVGIVLTAPLMLIIAAAIKLTSAGPVFYTQPRVGIDRRLSRGPNARNHRRNGDLGGRIFQIYKFRTMRPSRPWDKQVWAAQNDPRVTPVGRILRQFRLDELPQLFNVLQGDMNIVGPRPEQPEIFSGLRQEIVRYTDRQRVLPGITGLAQVTLPYDTELDGVKNKVELDLQYIRRRSAAQDLMIMARTMPVMVLRKGAL
jgi:lipopolysaccharide/colanic/teichoic acid biosynthesis glycosyltransferase